MKNCTTCGKEIMDKAVICPHCGCEQAEMKRCTECGAYIRKKAVICPKCGCPQDGYSTPTELRKPPMKLPIQKTPKDEPYANIPVNYIEDEEDEPRPRNVANQPDDKPSTLVNVISFLFPIIGLVVWAVSPKEKKRMGKAAGLYGLAGIAAAIILPFVVWLTAFGLPELVEKLI